MTKLYISAGADVNMRNRANGRACLHDVVVSCLDDGTWTREELPDQSYAHRIIDRVNALPYDYPAVFQVLIDAKADINVRAPEGKTPLYVAALNGNVDAVNALLAVGVNMNDTADDGSTPLMAASSDNRLDVVNVLIAAGADLNCVNANGLAAMMFAAVNNHVNIVSTLISAGVDVNRVYRIDGNDVTAVDVALSYDLVDTVAVLEKADAKTICHMMIETSDLVNAVACGDMEHVQQVVVNAGKDEMDMALVIAVRANLCSMVKCLLAAGADPDSTDCETRLLDGACIAGYTDIVRELIDAGADFTAKTKGGRTALQLAAQYKQRDVVALLLAKAKEHTNANK
jgi:ankyrin repeat protein